ncbi:MAG: hypothetical protein ACREQQ_14455, partial [Candidatus Binatia bacterium]
FCTVWWLTLLAFFEIAAYKRRAYLLPALPAEALLAGWFLDVRVLGGAETKPPSDAAGLALPRAVPAIGACTAAALLGWLVSPVLGSVGFEPSWSPTGLAVTLAAIPVMVYAVIVLVRAVRSSEYGPALLAGFAFLGAFYVGICPTGGTILASRLTAKELVSRIEAEIPGEGGFTMCGVGGDRSLLLLLYAEHPERIAVVPDGERCPERAPPGFYLLSRAEWRRLGERPDDAGGWRERLRGELRGWRARNPVVLAERMRPGDSRLHDAKP